MTINEVGELSTALLISLGMFVMGVYLVYVMFGAFKRVRLCYLRKMLRHGTSHRKQMEK